MSALMGSGSGVGRIVTRTCLLTPFVLLFVCQAHASQHQSSRQQSSKISANYQQIETLIQQGRLEEAKTAVQQDLQRNPSSVDGYNLLGIIESDEQDYSGALDAFQHALKLAPNSAKTHNNLGNVYVAEKKIDLAEKEFRTVLRLDPQNRDANYNMGVLLMAGGSPAEAIPHFERVHPANLATTFNLIHASFQSNRTADALRLATDLSVQNKNDVQVHFSLGVL